MTDAESWGQLLKEADDIEDEGQLGLFKKTLLILVIFGTLP